MRGFFYRPDCITPFGWRNTTKYNKTNQLTHSHFLWKMEAICVIILTWCFACHISIDRKHCVYHFGGLGYQYLCLHNNKLPFLMQGWCRNAFDSYMQVVELLLFAAVETALHPNACEEGMRPFVPWRRWTLTVGVKGWPDCSHIDLPRAREKDVWYNSLKSRN